MKLHELVAQPTTIDKLHESCFRSYQLLARVKELLAAGTPPSVVLEFINDVESFPQVDAERTRNGLQNISKAAELAASQAQAAASAQAATTLAQKPAMNGRMIS